MRIVYLHQYFVTPQMVGGTRSYEMGRRLVAAGHEVFMVTSHRSGEAPVRAGWYETEEAGMNVSWLVNSYSNDMQSQDRIKAFLRFAASAARKAASIKADVVFASSTPLTIALPGYYAARHQHIPMVFEVRDLWPDAPIAMGAIRGAIPIAAARWLERFAYQHSAEIVALSPGMKAGVAATGYPEERISVIPNGSDIELFRVPQSQGERFLAQHPALLGGPVVTYAGSLGSGNGVDYLVEIAQAMSALDPAVRFLIVGDGKQRDSIAQLAEQQGVLNRNLWMLPPVPKQDMPLVLAATTLSSSFVVDLPHNQNNSANKLFDAFAAARPILINHGGWQQDLLENSGAGFAIPPRDPAVAAALIRDFVRDPARVARAGAASARLADEQFGRDRLANELREVLERVTARCGKR